MRNLGLDVTITGAEARNNNNAHIAPLGLGKRLNNGVDRNVLTWEGGEDGFLRSKSRFANIELETRHARGNVIVAALAHSWPEITRVPNGLEQSFTSKMTAFVMSQE